MPERLSSNSDQFPRSSAQTLTVPGQENGPVSPFRSTFSFDKRDNGVQHASAGSDLIDEKKIAWKLKDGVPVDMEPTHPRHHEGQSRRKSSFYGDVFAYRESNISPKDRIARESLVMAEVKTNVIIKDEYAFITNLSHHLSLRFARPESLIMVNVAHSACLIFGGTFDPAYTLALTALPSQIQPTTNKRNAAVTQTFMTEALGVPAHRGVIKFVAIAEENLATHGQTVLGEMEALDRNTPEESGSRKSSVSISKNENRKKSIAAVLMHNDQRKKSHAGIPMHTEQAKMIYGGHAVQTLPIIEKSESRTDSMDPPGKGPPSTSMPTEKTSTHREAEPVQKVGRRKSIMAMFGK
ncbi:MAG: hypothetical protein M1830_001570 [Pleopsidium flavum]|nr:MAG: hypothetical protein M1830_001570 [Pleopsidium flavum]